MPVSSNEDQSRNPSKRRPRAAFAFLNLRLRRYSQAQAVLAE
jgi:hypothetical protein